MPIHALALLRVPPFPQRASALRVDLLADASIVHTRESFANEPEQLLARLLQLVGADILAQHSDPRGVLFIPDVALLKARSYEAVVDEVGEGGVWAPLAVLAVDDDGDLGALLGNMLAQLPPSLLTAASAAAQGDRGALDSLGTQLQSLLGSSPGLQSLAGQLSGMLGQPGPHTLPAEPELAAPPELAALEQMFAGFGGGEAASASLRQLASQMQSELAADPEAFQRLAQQFLGDSGGADDDEEESPPAPREPKK